VSTPEVDVARIVPVARQHGLNITPLALMLWRHSDRSVAHAIAHFHVEEILCREKPSPAICPGLGSQHRSAVAPRPPTLCPSSSCTSAHVFSVRFSFLTETTRQRASYFRTDANNSPGVQRALDSVHDSRRGGMEMPSLLRKHGRPGSYPIHVMGTGLIAGLDRFCHGDGKSE